MLIMNYESIQKKENNNADSIIEKLKETPIELLPEKSTYSIEELRGIIPEGEIVVCDFYVNSIENGHKYEYGFENDGVINIDHHAPDKSMSKQVSSANLAIEFVNNRGPVPKNSHIIIHHTDCDSILSSSIVRGILPPDKKFGEAAIAADHTGAPNEIADLLQAIQEKRDLQFSLKNLNKLMSNEKLDEEAEQMLLKRFDDRKKAEEIVKAGNFERIGNIYFSTVSEKFDAGMLPALLPDASVIIIGLPMKDNPAMWELKIRLGMSAPAGTSLNTLNLPNFGGRWNAGSTKRSGGTELNPKEYAELLNEKISNLNN